VTPVALEICLTIIRLSISAISPMLPVTLRSILGRGIPGVDSVEYTGNQKCFTISSILEKHDQMMAHNNLIVVETLHPDNTIAKLAVLTKNMSEEEEQASEVNSALLNFSGWVRFFSVCVPCMWCTPRTTKWRSRLGSNYMVVAAYFARHGSPTWWGICRYSNIAGGRVAFLGLSTLTQREKQPRLLLQRPKNSPG
jgi:hypothetical protein